MELLLFTVLLVFILFIYNCHQTACTDSSCDPNYNYKKYKKDNYTNVSALENTDYNTQKHKDYDHYKHLIFG